MAGTGQRPEEDAKEEFLLLWLADQLKLLGSPIKIGRGKERLFQFSDGTRLYYERRQPANGGYWLGFRQNKIDKISGDCRGIYVAFLNDDSLALIIEGENLREMLEIVKMNGDGQRQIVLKQIGEKFIAHASSGLNEDLSSHIRSVGAFTNPEQCRKAARHFHPSSPPTGKEVVRKSTVSQGQFQRSPAVASWVLDQAKGVCELCGSEAPFVDVDGTPYLEVHYVTRLADGGPDTPDNCIAVCPNCHRRLHHGRDAEVLRSFLFTRLPRLVHR